MSDKKGVQEILSEVISGPHKVVTEDLAKQILSEYGLQGTPIRSSKQRSASSQGG